GEHFINRKQYGLNTILRSFMAQLDRPVTLEEFSDHIMTSPLCQSLTLKSELERSSYTNIVNLIERIDEFIRVERYTWALKKHLNYPESCWSEIWNACHEELESLGHQADAGYLFRTIKGKYPGLRSKYELAHILKGDSALTNLGFLTYNLSKTGQQERITIEKVLREIFGKDWKPKHFEEITKEIQRKRGFRREAIGLFHKQFDFLRLYPPAYYGLLSRNTENIEYLKNDINYLESYISYRRKDTSFVVDITDELDIDQDLYSFIEFLTKSNSLVTIQIPHENNAYCILSKNWGIVRIMVSILANYNRPLFFEQMRLIAKNELNLQFDESTTRYKLDRDSRVTKERDGSYIYNTVLKEKNDYLPLLDEIEDYFINNPKIVHIDELYNIVREFSENPTPDSKGDLFALINVDNRFSVINGEMIGIL
ncbi:MAG: hypothetical protein ACE5H1_10925, partial [Thermodesulfobacteriota bacterium]